MAAEGCKLGSGLVCSWSSRCRVWGREQGKRRVCEDRACSGQGWSYLHQRPCSSVLEAQNNLEPEDQTDCLQVVVGVGEELRWRTCHLEHRKKPLFIKFSESEVDCVCDELESV